MGFKSESPAEVQERLRQDTIRQREASLSLSEGQAHRPAEERDAQIAEAVEAHTAPLDQMELQRRELASRGATGALENMPSAEEGVSIQGVDGGADGAQSGSGSEQKPASRARTSGTRKSSSK